VHVCTCGADLGPGDGNPKDACSATPVAPSDLAPIMGLHDELTMTRYACPGCGRTHAIEARREQDVALHEAELTLGGGA
jgi:hypothetical protein